MAKNRIYYLIILVGLALFYIYCDSYMPLVILLIVAILPIFTGIIGYFASRKTTVSVSPLLASVTKGRELPFNIKIKNDSKLPLSTVRVILEFTALCDDSFEKRKIFASVSSGEEKNICMYGSIKHCTIVRCKIKKAAGCDGTGIFSFKLKQNRGEAEIVVMPELIKTGFDFGDSAKISAESDRYSETQRGDDSSQVFEVREYVPGDDIRRIHWRLSSKQDSLIVKEYSKPMADECAVLLETGLDSGDPELKNERADKILAAFLTLANAILHDEQTISVCWYSSSAEKLLSFDISSYDEVYSVVRLYLSDKLSEIANVSLHNYESLSETAMKTLTYYVYDSAYSDIADNTKKNERYFLIDTGKVEPFEK